nr:MAG TPA: hypothetical protein [Caudoviricetes sp.]
MFHFTNNSHVGETCTLPNEYYFKKRKFMERNTYFVIYPTGASGYLSDKTEEEMKRMKKVREILYFTKK